MEAQTGSVESARTTKPMSQIEHVVVLMLENRSLDSLLGWLYEHDRPLHNIPALKPGERTYEGLQDLNLDDYVNSSFATNRHYDIELSLQGVLIAGNFVVGKWADAATLRGDHAALRAAVIEQLKAHCTYPPGFASVSDDELIGMAGAAIYLFGRDERDRADLQRTTPDDQRNGLIVVMTRIELDRRRDGYAPQIQGADEKGIARTLQGKTTKDLVAQATHGQPWLRAGREDLNLPYENDLRLTIDLSYRGILVAGNLIEGGWAVQDILDADDARRRAAVLQQVNAHSAVPNNKPLEKATADELIGAAGAILFLVGHGNRDRAWLRTRTPEDHRNTLIVVLTNIELNQRDLGVEPRVEGKDRDSIVRSLQTKSTKDLVRLATGDKAWLRLRVPPVRGSNALNAPNFSPGESFSEVTRQMFGKEHLTDEEAKRPPAMKGFLKDYVHVLKHERGCSDEQIVRYADQVMRSYTPDQLPVLNGLAKHYAVCDMWFSSVPSQTNTNRAFAFCGTSKGLVNNGFLEEDKRAQPIETLAGYKLGDDRFHAKTLFNALAEGGKTSWKIFYRCGMLQENLAKAIDIYRGLKVSGVGLSALAALFVQLVESSKGINLDYLRSLCDSSVDSMYSYRLFPELTKAANKEANCAKFEKFHEAARAGALPNFTFIEPEWSISPQSTGSTLGADVLYHLGDDYHPPCNLDGGETLVRSVYSSLISNEEAWKKTLLVITFDEPVGAFDHVPPPAAVPPWGTGEPGVACEEGFKFNRYGARVATLLISPLIEKGTVFRSTTGTPYDHTSLIATILKWRGLDGHVSDFGERTRGAPTFESVITRTEPRNDARQVGFLDEAPKNGDVVKYHDRFCLRNEDGRYISDFKEDSPGWAWVGVLFEKDPALTEFFPRVSDDPTRQTQFYLVNAENRADAGPVMRYASADARLRARLKLIAVESGLGSYTVLGLWGDSWHCYYSNDYIEGDVDQRESWRITKSNQDGPASDKLLRYGQKITIENVYKPGYFLAPHNEWIWYSGSESTWTVLPTGPH